MRASAYGVAASLISALFLGGGLSGLFAGDVRLEYGQLLLGEHRFMLRGVNYGRADSLRPCLYARDLPLIAALGANTVRTSRLLDHGDTAFVPLLETTGLHWLAGFPLEPFYDPSRPISARKAEILEAFESYVLRFRGQPRLVAYVFGDGVLENYNSRFSGPISDFYDLLAEAAALLRALEPDQTPLLATGVRNLARLRDNPPGLAFWVYDAGAVRTLSSAIDEIRRSGSKPVLIGGYGVNAEDEDAQALAALDLTREIEAEGSLLGGLYAGFADDGAGPAFSSRSPPGSRDSTPYSHAPSTRRWPDCGAVTPRPPGGWKIHPKWLR